MPRSDLTALRGRGLFLREGFLSPTACRQLRLDAQSGVAEPATIVGDGGEVIVDRRVRRAESIDIADAALRKEVTDHFDALIPTLASRFDVVLSGFEPPYVARYPVGGFYRPHVDTDVKDHETAETARRKVSCVVFLNGATSPVGDEDFAGGALAFYRLAGDPTGETRKTVLYPAPTLLVAFPSGVYHEVLPVMAGCRWTLVTWFH